MALRKDNPSEAVKLWVLRNAMEEGTQQLSTQDDFDSVTWGGPSDMGPCLQDLSTDDDGAGLWPISLHNWVVRASDAPNPRTNPWETFELARRSRGLSIHSVLGTEELRTEELRTEELRTLELAAGRCGSASAVLQRVDSLTCWLPRGGCRR
ncbi:MAG: hypothetical protein ACJAV2_004288 [Myxococcota bacterium]|jgi:hypothetical protein